MAGRSIDTDTFSKNATGDEIVIIMNPYYRQEIKDFLLKKGKIVLNNLNFWVIKS